MPIYVYECITCVKDFEIAKPIAEIDLPEACPDCGRVGKRVMAPTNFVLKGSGWSKQTATPTGKDVRKNLK